MPAIPICRSMRLSTRTTLSPRTRRPRLRAASSRAISRSRSTATRMKLSWPITTAMSACTRRSWCAWRARSTARRCTARSRRPSAASSTTSPSRRILATLTAPTPSTCSTSRSASRSARNSSARSSTAASRSTASPLRPKCSITSRRSATSIPPSAPSRSPSRT